MFTSATSIYMVGSLIPSRRRKGVPFTVRSATDRRACRTNDALALCPPSPCGRSCPFHLLNFTQSRPLHAAGCAMMDHWRATHTTSASCRKELLRLFDMLSVRRFGDQGHCQDLDALRVDKQDEKTQERLSWQLRSFFRVTVSSALPFLQGFTLGFLHDRPGSW
jgi:hypothetical protein